jgi:hypothetical protein
MEKGVIFSMDEGLSLFTVSIFGGYDDYLNTIKVLMSTLQNCDNKLSRLETYLICNLISDMLPSYNQMKILYDIQRGEKECIEKREQ